MGAKTNYLEDAIINHIFRGIPYTPPAGLHVALFTAVTDGEAGTVTEVPAAGGGYARVSVPPGVANWAAPAGGNGTTSNVNAVTFPAPNAQLGQVTHWGIYDAAVGGNLLYYAPLTTPKTINNGDPAPYFAPGALTVQEDT